MDGNISCVLPLSGRQPRGPPNICSISRMYSANLTKLPPGANLGFNVTPAQVVSKGARDVRLRLRKHDVRSRKCSSKPSSSQVLMGGLSQARLFYRMKTRPKLLRVEDSLEILFATAKQCCSVLMRESEAKKRESFREEDDMPDEEAAAVFTEGILLANMAGDIKKSISEARRKRRDILDMHDYLRSRLELVLEDLLQ